MPTPFNSKYSSTEIENFFDLLNSNSFITNTVSNLVNYYLKSDTYSKSEVDSIINTVKNGRFQNVNSLPEQDIDTNVIYLVQKQNTENNNIKDEYINLDGTSTGWEKIGSTEINLDGYVTIQALNTALSNYVQSSNIVTILANRTSFSSVENMIATPAADLYDGCLAYVTATKKNYQYDSSNEADPTLGKWRELQTGGGGGTNYTAGDGIDITEDVISTKQSEEGDIDEIIDVYPQAGSLVSIVNAFNRGDIYSTDEKMIGQWVDGKPLYQKTITGLKTPSTTGSWQTVYTYDTTFNIVNMFGYLINEGMSINTFAHASYYVISVFVNGSHVIQQQVQNYTNQDEIITIQYTKTTDTAISIGSETEYSTDEKVIGTWLDGKPIYQRTIDVGAVSAGTDITYSLSGWNIDVIVKLGGNGYASYGQWVEIGFPHQRITEYGVNALYNVSNQSIIIHSGTVCTLTQCYITIQYTKSTT